MGGHSLTELALISSYCSTRIRHLVSDYYIMQYRNPCDVESLLNFELKNVYHVKQLIACSVKLLCELSKLC